MTKENEDFKKKELIKENKSKILTEAKSKYSQGVIDISAKTFDFSVDDADNKFYELCADNSKLLGVPLIQSKEPPKDGLPPELSSFLAKQKAKKEEAEAKKSAFEKLMK